jgi:hypothetical protein
MAGHFCLVHHELNALLGLFVDLIVEKNPRLASRIRWGRRPS